MEREPLGHIDCPTCGTKGGMRITLDKNGDPFGFCEAECNQQMRVGGSPRRVAMFVSLYPWAGGKKEAAPVETKPEKPPTVPVPVPVTVPEKPPRPAPQKRGVFDLGL